MNNIGYFHQVPTLVDEDGYVISNTANDFYRRLGLVHWLDWDLRIEKHPMKKCRTCKAKILAKRSKRVHCWVCEDITKLYNEHISNEPLSTKTLEDFFKEFDKDYDSFH